MVLNHLGASELSGDLVEAQIAHWSLSPDILTGLGLRFSILTFSYLLLVGRSSLLSNTISLRSATAFGQILFSAFFFFFNFSYLLKMFIFITILLIYNSHTIQLTHLKCIIQWILLKSQVDATITTILEHFHHHQKKPKHISGYSPFFPTLQPSSGDFCSSES